MFINSKSTGKMYLRKEELLSNIERVYIKVFFCFI